MIDGPAVSSMHSISLTTFFVCFRLNELSEFSKLFKLVENSVFKDLIDR